ncbi:uncharacterized protein LOC128959262 [Oppia nitens]|uniref:uncharacterized protein LOC128959253 n=1 Tax=Oppia nitens TaxID=1686743 RepID=UPI0023DC0C74|nr:uncharacterized protein LOC128959253 [Oppia nitens]XP_054161176.1 uncharacterized protein LOC128959262 [Oppia nitens]
MSCISPEVYADITNNIDAIYLESIQLITNDKRSYDLIVDLGFGDGRLTRMLSQNVSHKQLIAIDVVPEMLAHAVANSSDDTSIEYVLQDMSVPWLELSPHIRQLESKVDLLFTNVTLNYMSNKRQIMEIIGKLLTNGGLFFANIVIYKDLNEKQLLDNKFEESQQQLCCQSIDQQFNDWKQSLIDNKFHIKQFKLLDENEIMTRKQIIDYMPEILDCSTIYYKDRTLFDKEVKSDRFKDKVFNTYFSLPVGASVTETNHQPVLMSWKQFLADNSINEMKFSWHFIQFKAYNK